MDPESVKDDACLIFKFTGVPSMVAVCSGAVAKYSNLNIDSLEVEGGSTNVKQLRRHRPTHKLFTLLRRQCFSPLHYCCVLRVPVFPQLWFELCDILSLQIFTNIDELRQILS